MAINSYYQLCHKGLGKHRQNTQAYMGLTQCLCCRCDIQQRTRGEKIRMGYRQAGCHPEPDSGPSHFLVCSDHTTCYYDDLVKHETAGRVGNVCSVWYIATAKWSHTPFFAPAPQSAPTNSFGSALRSWSKNFIDKKYTWPTVNGYRAKSHKASMFDLILQSQRKTEGRHANH